MSKKLTIEVIERAAKQTGIDDEHRRALLEMLADMTADVDEEKPPAIKKQFVILISDPLGVLPAGHDFVGWVLQIPENESVMTTTERIHKAAYLFNTSKKGRLMPAKTVGETLEHVPAFFFKENDVFVKTKTPVLMLTTDNEIPAEKTERSVA
jgi:hypothetical protein